MLPGYKGIKSFLNLLFAVFILSYAQVTMAATLEIDNPYIAADETITVSASGLSGDRDWVGVYRKNDSNDWANVLSWNWVKNGTSMLDGVAGAGEYEARLFFHNSFNLEASAVFTIASITISKPRYKPGEAINLTLAGLSGDRDWVGIYRKGDSNDWSNVLAWDWANNAALSLQGVANTGEYEARLFFHNSFNLQASVAFDVSSTSIATSKPSYSPNESITITLAGLSGDRDWVGIYRKGDSNDWGNVLSWDWANSNTLTLSGVPNTGEYEARLFFHNSYSDEANIGFKVASNDVVDYAEYGPYLSDRSDINQRISIYKPKKYGVIKQHSPVVIVSTGGWGGKGTTLENFINYVVSKGYFVIGVGTGSDREAEFNGILDTLNNQGDLVDKTNIGLIGSSTGGGAIFYNLKRLQDVGYAANSFAISLDGWFALGLLPAEVRNLHTTTLLLQFGGADGLHYSGTETVNPAHGNNDHFQDARILMSIYNMLPGNEKSLSFLNNNEHGYAYGNMDGKEDMLSVVGAMLAYKFGNGGQAAKNVALNNKYDEIDAAKFNVSQYRYGCSDNIADQYYNYCDVNNPQ